MKTILITCMLLACGSGALACDICGSGAGNNYLGLLPDFKKKFIGIRYQHNSLRNHLGQNGTPSYLTARERYNIVEAWGAANVGKKFRLSFSIPYVMMKRFDHSGLNQRRGLGDVMLTGYYNLITSKKTVGEAKLFAQSVWLGAGAKAPTGDYDSEEKNVVAGAQNTFQLGTGSFDFVLQAIYDARLQDAGINVSTGYKVNTKNEDGYFYGNKFTANVLGYYKFKTAGKFGIVPNTGILFEKAQKDRGHTGVPVFETGGQSLMGVVGVELAWKTIGGGFNFQKPISQNLGESRVKGGIRLMTYVSISF